MIAQSTRWCVAAIWMTGIQTIYTVATEDRAKELAQATKDQYKGCRVFVGYEIAQSTSTEAMEEDNG